MKPLPLFGILTLGVCLSSPISADVPEGRGIQASPASNESGIVRRPAPLDFKRGDLTVWPSRGKKTEAIDLRSYDLSGWDLGSKGADLVSADFDSRTKWPGRLPDGFDPVRMMDLGRNPGLGVRSLHERGITGRGIGIAIIDQTLLTDHVEYRDRLRLYEEIGLDLYPAQIHGPAVASIAAGKTVGVAPEADLYYIASFFGSGTAGEFSRDFTFSAQAVDRLLEVNRTLPRKNRIRVISLSIGWDPREKGYAEMCAAVDRAKEAGIFVVSSSLTPTYGDKLRFHGLGREPPADPDAAASYGPGSWWEDQFYSSGGGPAKGVETLLIPMDSRTMAGPTGAVDYVFYRNGGWSWSIPYIAGLYALSCQVDPEITPEIFWAKALETGDTVVMPAREKAVRSPEEIERMLQKNFLEPLAQLKARTKPGDLEKMIAEGYNRMTGKKLEKMSEADFIAWARTMAEGRSDPRPLKTIVNPVRLIDALVRR
ncbi:MAG: S8/S53 family peptidase [Candidatus Aminicenantes bacterium]|nr:S8/S53 family peptidase [Candidatus Aminicenantes bacterium]